MKAHYTIQCDHPDTGKRGSWIFSGDNHRNAGTSLSPVFPDAHQLFLWMNANGWKPTSGSVMECEQS